MPEGGASGEEFMVLVASSNDVRNFAAMLRGLSFASRVTLAIHDAGIQATVEDSRILLGTAYIPVNIFDEFIFRPEKVNPENDHLSPSQISDTPDSVVFEVPLDALLECLNIFGSGMPVGGAGGTSSGGRGRGGGDSDDEVGGRRGGRRAVDLSGGGANGKLDHYFHSAAELRKTGMRMGYGGRGYPLSFLLAEEASGPLTTVDITTFEPEPQLELPFDDDNKVLWVILSSSWLRETLSEFDSSCENVTLIAKPLEPSSKEPCLSFKASGNHGSAQMDYLNDPHVLETFECSADVQFRYRLSHINRALRALQSSSKASIRIDDQGLLSMQFLMNTTEGAFLEFRFVPLQED